MRGDWKDEAMQYRDIDRAAQAAAEKELEMEVHMSTKHTPGPWSCERQDDDDGSIYYAIHAHAGYEFIVNVHENKANARLIAAAPDLLHELEHLVRLIEPHIVHTVIPGLATLNGARAAIAKAIGNNK